jgi:hypothetical protein
LLHVITVVPIAPVDLSVTAMSTVFALRKACRGF